ncbi:Rieske 2Fe-2S domain-containing protein [Mycobacterium intracellulare]|uniref:Rieske 2Fe-2S domain-containing protein n=1 Tax=Mycobacterium intracellulare TaxID=1767 RepID=UPI0021E6A45D|nr:Rieske 2Fe-2S domain-containing protein [Mycobacterium intracellulare]
MLCDEDGAVWALSNTCTHEGAYLAEGWLQGATSNVRCALRFCLKTSAVEALPATEDTVAHRVEVRDGVVYLFPRETP